MWTLYRVRFDFLTSLCASVPANPELVKAWTDARKPSVRPPQSRGINEIQEEVFSTLAVEEEEEIPKSLLVFQRHEDGLVLRSATIRAHIKDCARQLSVYYIGKIEKEKSFATRVINCVYLDEMQYWIPIQKDGEWATEATGRRDKPVHTWQGNALKTIEFIDDASIEFTLKVLSVRGNGTSKYSVSEKDADGVPCCGDESCFALMCSGIVVTPRGEV